jgi:hypothetical protein
MEKQIINLFWTSGWDSTFRLLYILITEDVSIQPIYIINLKRKSSWHELKTLAVITQAIKQKYPLKFQQLLPVNIFLKNDIKIEDNIAVKYQKLRTEFKIGTQYKWLCSFAKQFDYQEIEMCLERKPEHCPGKINNLVSDDSEGNGHDRILKENPSVPALEIFRPFRFPIMLILKQEMLETATKFGFADIMQLAWFCHHPLPFDINCGYCAACKITKRSYIKEFYEKRTVKGKIKSFID